MQRTCLLAFLAAGCATVTDDTSVYDTSLEPDTAADADETDAAVEEIADDTDAADAVDTAPPWDAPDSPDATDAWDAWDTADAADAGDSFDWIEAFDTVDAFDGTDAPDAVETIDAYDAPDTADPPDDPDASELCGGATCAPGQECCSSACTWTTSDFDHCGSCTTPCYAAKTSECVGGTCLCDGDLPCSSYAYMRCCTPDGCVATDFNDSHCGDCYRPCSGGTTCSFGSCH